MTSDPRYRIETAKEPNATQQPKKWIETTEIEIELRQGHISCTESPVYVTLGLDDET